MVQIARIGTGGELTYSEEELLNISSPSSVRRPQAIASGKLSITDGIIEGFAADSALAGGFQIDEGKFLMFFTSSQEDTDYIVNVFDGGMFRCDVLPEDYGTDFFIITTTDLGGIPASPSSISLIIMRAV